ncbi:TF211 protein, partial [Leiothrix lutea]|nr:TF211 protein [Leiothrix lutea]
IHALTHWGMQGLCDHFLREHLCVGVYNLATMITEGCPLSQKINQKVMRKTKLGGRPIALRLFQNIQSDFTETPAVQGYKHLSVIADHLTHWVEAFPTKQETAQVVVKILLENIIPRYGLENNIDSDSGPHFTAQVGQETIKALGIKWRLHIPWHPQSSGRVERMNKTLKNVLTKLIATTGMNWLKCLPLTLLRIRVRPRSDIKVSPYEMMFGLPFLLTPYSAGDYLDGEAEAQNYIRTISNTLADPRKRGHLPQASPLDTDLHQIKPGDWVFVKTWIN